MPKMVMCKDETCENRMSCHRFTAKPAMFKRKYMQGRAWWVNHLDEWDCAYYIKLPTNGPMGFVEEALNTTNASWWELKKAKWFGTKWIAADEHVVAEGRSYNGKCYLFDWKK